MQHGKPSLVCDFMELYRYLIDDFLIEYCRNLSSNDFVAKTENLSRKKQGKRQYLNNKQTRELIKKLDLLFARIVEVPRIKVGKKQTIRTVINEECLLFAKFLRNERNGWQPRLLILKIIGIPDSIIKGGQLISDCV